MLWILLYFFYFALKCVPKSESMVYIVNVAYLIKKRNREASGNNFQKFQR